MKIYIDSDYKCHISGGDGMRQLELPFFDGKCQTYIEGYRYLPPGESWTRSDGQCFVGEMIAPHKNYLALYLAQLEYELAQARDHLVAAEVSSDA